MSDSMKDPRHTLQPTLDDMFYRVSKRLCQEDETEGDALYRSVVEEGQSVQSIADVLELTLARVRYLFQFCGVGMPTRRTKKDEVHAIMREAEYGYETRDIAKQLGLPHSKVLDYAQAFDIDVIITED